MSLTASRLAEYPIDPVFTRRWSPRSFTGARIDDLTLQTIFEAARWAPSANNSQPWRFVYVRRESAQWQALYATLNEGNRRWADKAAVLVVLVSKTTHRRRGEHEETPLRNHAFDAGAAWAALALQAVQSGWHTHAIGGFDKEAARHVLGIPEGFHLNIAIAIGQLGDRAELPADLQEREQPSPRHPQSSLVAEGRFSFSS